MSDTKIVSEWMEELYPDFQVKNAYGENLDKDVSKNSFFGMFRRMEIELTPEAKKKIHEKTKVEVATWDKPKREDWQEDPNIEPSLGKTEDRYQASKADGKDYKPRNPSGDKRALK